MTRAPRQKSRFLYLLIALVCLLVLAGFSLWFTLKQGITIRQLRLASCTAEHVSIRLDQGLLINVQYLDIADKKLQETAPDPEKLLAMYDTWSPLFQEISLNQINFRGQTYELLFRDKQLNLSGSKFDAQAKIDIHPEKIEVDLERFEMPPFPVTVSGTATFLPTTGEILFAGNFNGSLVSGALNGSLKDDRIKAVLSTDQFEDLAGVLRLFPIDEDIVEWIAGNITAGLYRIEKLELNVPLEDGKPIFSADSITGVAVASNVAILFDPSLPPINTGKIHISYSNDQQITLSSDIINLRGKVTIDSGKVETGVSQLEIKPYLITVSGNLTFTSLQKEIIFTGNFKGPLVSGKLSASLNDGKIEAALSTEEFTDLAGLLHLLPIDEGIITWIADNITADHYRINKLEFNVPLEDGKPMFKTNSITGLAVGTNAAIRFDPSLPPVKTEKINISYLDDQLTFTLSNPRYGGKDLSGSTVAITNLMGSDTHLVIDIRTNSPLDEEIHTILNTYNIQVPLTQKSGSIDTKLHLDFDLPDFSLQSRGNFVADKSEWSCNSIDFSVTNANVRLVNDTVFIDDAAIKTKDDIEARLTGSVDTEAKHIFLNTDIPLLDIQDGKLDINFTDPENLSFSGNVNTTILPLSLNGVPVTHYSFTGNRTSKRLDVSINDKKISLILTEMLRIRLRDYLLTMDLQKEGNTKRTASPFPITLSGPKSLITSEKLAILTKSFRAQLKGSGIDFAAELSQGKILFESNDAGMSLTATDMDANLAQDFFSFANLEKGKFNLSLKGKSPEDYEGYVEFSNVVIKDMALLNNVLSFINTVPALATFSSPGFDSNGYHVSEGIVLFTMSGKLLTIDKLRTNGTTINTEAEGWIDFENNILKVNLELISLKDYSKILSKIPWAGYIILGENGSISTSLLISGNRNAPKITTNLTSEIIMLPLNMVKRTITWPFNLFNKIKEIVTEEPEEEK